MRHRIEVFAGVCTDIEARVYAQLLDGPDDERVTLVGRLRGPFCEHARTLVAETAFRDLGPGPTALAGAIVSDPCTWSPDMPHWYEVEVEARAAGRVVGETRGMFGILRFGARGEYFMLDGRRWVIRGASCDTVPCSPLDMWRRERMAMLVPEPTDELCEAASREGVMLLAQVTERDSETVANELFRLARWPAVALAILPAEAQSPFDETGWKPKNMLLAQLARSGGAPPGGADAIAIDVATLRDVKPVRSRPLIAMRRARQGLAMVDARRQCDTLQCELASTGDFAGYVV